MSFSTRHTPVVLVLLFSLSVFVSAQTTTKQTAKTPRGSIAGRVTIKDKGVAGVAVGLRKSDVFMPYETYLKATTDHDGYYRIGNLAPGSYDVTASAPAFVITDAGQKSKAVIVGDDENVDGINFSLVRGGVITGKVTDADGRPLIMQQVYLYLANLPEQPGGVSRPPYASTAVLTDDRGIYRMYGLTAGSYRVAAGRSDDQSMGPFSLSRSSYRRVFHPDATEQAKATVIEVREGSETGNVDITLGRPMQTFSVSGRVIDGEKGTPIPNIRLGLQRTTGPRFEMVPTQITSNALGDFVIEGIVPGKYGFYLFQTVSQNQLPDMRVETFTFDVADQDVTGINVRITKGASLTGVVLLDSDDKAVVQRFQKLQMRAYVNTPGAPGYGQSSGSPIGADGSFRLGGLAGGTANLFLTSTLGFQEARGFYVTRVERDGVSQSRGIEMKDGEQIGGLRVVVSYGSAKIRGVVKFENGTMPPEAQISVQLARVGENFSHIPGPQVDARGLFVIEGVPAGLYEMSVSVFRTSVIRGPSTTIRRVTQQVNVQDGVVTDVVVTIDLGQAPK